MTAPWTPAPNPGGRNREFIRKVTAQWIVDAAIPGLDHVYPGLPWVALMNEGAGSLYRCNLAVHVGDIGESREATSGPTDPGGKDAHYGVQLTLKHRCLSVEGDDWWQAEDDHDRILDAIKDRLRAEGRDLGRADVVLQAGDWPKDDSIHSTTEEPVYENGVRDQWTTISFLVTQYMQRQP